jgi:hypothetical protein
VINVPMIAFGLLAQILFALWTGVVGGHLPWPLVQWALTSPLGTIILGMVAGLVCGATSSAILLLIFRLTLLVDVTGVPVYAWPSLRQLARDPARGTQTDKWLGRTQQQRRRSWLAIALGALLLLGLLVAAFASLWYTLTHAFNCSAEACAPVFIPQLTFLPLVVGEFLVLLSLVVWVARVERRSGVWFRTRAVFESGLVTYIRRPGVTPEVAAAALRPYTRGVLPAAQALALVALAFVPCFLWFIGGMLLSAWLSTQWIPG